MTQTLGQFLLNDNLPDGFKLEGPVTKKTLQTAMTRLAKQDPEKYIKVVQDVKRFGDEVATWEGISVGLDDIAADRANRDPIIKDALHKVRNAKSDEERRKILYETEDRIKDITGKHPSDMVIMARSGGRGSIAQLMKTVASPVVASDSDGRAYPWLITKSYAQGLSASEAWVAGSEARRNAIASTGSVVEPGAVAKVIVTNMEDQVVTTPDCRTSSGLVKPVSDRNVQDRYLAKPVGGFVKDTLVTPEVVDQLRKSGVRNLEVRSPMTCNAVEGVCQKCMGQNARGQDYDIGINVGSLSAQALTEPLTQFALNAKHGVRMVGGGKSHELTGLRGFRVLTEVPASFTEKAALAKLDGKVSRIDKAPQGGHYIFVGGTRHYTPPRLPPIVKVGDLVEKGDALSDGTPMPNAVVEAKGIGEGRRYLSDSLNKLYERQGVDIDHRHTELLAKKALNYVQVEHDPTNTLLEGDIVSFDRVKPIYHKNKQKVPVDKAEGRLLAIPVLHYTEGTRVTPSVISFLKRNGVDAVDVATKVPEITPVMKSVIQTPLLDDDWMSRLSHRYLKKTLVEGAGFGLESNISSTNPIPAYISSPHFGHRPDGKYAQEKTAAPRVLKPIKNVLFGRGSRAVDSRLSQQLNRGAADSIRVIGRTGGVDYAGESALRFRQRFGDDALEKLNVIDRRTGQVTDRGAKILSEMDSALKKDFQTVSAADPRTGISTLDRLRQLGVSDSLLNETSWRELHSKNPSTAARAARFVREALIGANPIRTTRQRYETGGILGRGGVVFGDLGISPDAARAWRGFRSAETGGEKFRELSNLVTSGASDLAFNKYFSYGIPAAGLYASLTSEPGPEDSPALRVASPIMETIGWSLGSPFGMLGASHIASNITNIGEAALGLVDTASREALQVREDNMRDRGASERALRAASQVYSGHKSAPVGHFAYDKLSPYLTDPPEIRTRGGESQPSSRPPGAQVSQGRPHEGYIAESTPPSPLNQLHSRPGMYPQHGIQVRPPVHQHPPDQPSHRGQDTGYAQHPRHLYNS